MNEPEDLRGDVLSAMKQASTMMEKQRRRENQFSSDQLNHGKGCPTCGHSIRIENGTVFVCKHRHNELEARCVGKPDPMQPPGMIRTPGPTAFGMPMEIEDHDQPYPYRYKG